MTVREIYGLAKQFNAAMRARSIGKVASSEDLCGLKDFWALPKTFPWYVSGLCQMHDKFFDEGTETLWSIQKWWVVNAWKHSTTWEMKLFYFLVTPTVLSVTAARYRQRNTR